MLTITCADPVVEKCDCCDGQSTRLTRVVQKDGVPHAIYYAMFTEPHPEQHVTAVVSLGDFGNGSGPDDREAFAIALRKSDEGVEVLVKDATQCPWQDVALLGRKLTRDEALHHPRLGEVFEITNQMPAYDAPLFRYLAQSGGCSSCGGSCG